MPKKKKKTETIVSWEDLGDAANRTDLRSFANAIRDGAFDDNRVADYEVIIVRDHWGDDVELRVIITGDVTAKDFVDEVFAGEHGAW